VKNHYDLLEIEPGAAAEQIKHAFRQQIARYHPDKVQHLGRELRELAATRTAELTEAYRVLSNPATRDAYDQTLTAADSRQPAVAARPRADEPPASAPPHATASARTASTLASPFTHDRNRRDEVVRRAAVNRFRQALAAEYGSVADSGLRGFDVASVARRGLFSRDRRPRIVGRFVDRVDGETLVDTWRQAAAWTDKDVCVFLMGSELAPPGELAEATTRQRATRRAGQVLVVPVDARDWQALVPSGAPAAVRAVLERLRTGA
jgi:curved DNA-binding protein CbpA